MTYSFPSLPFPPKNPAEEPGGAARKRPADHGFLKAAGAPGVTGAAASQRMAARKRSSQCLL